MLNKNLSKSLLVALGVGLSLNVSAREILNQPASSGGPGYGGSGNKVAAACLNSSSSSVLDINNVRTTVLNGGDMWWNLLDPRYEVPKVNDPNQPKKHSLFAGSVWIGGKDAQNNLYLAGQTYRQSNQVNYWPGPLDATGNISKDACAAWNFHAKIDKSMVLDFIASYNAGAYGSDPLLLPKAIREWPGRNNPHLRIPGIENDNAPFVNVGGDPNEYDPMDGDYPAIQGDQAIWWVMNDAGNTKTPLSKTIGLELQVMAFAFQTNDLINNMTFYKQTLKNKGTVTLNSTYLGQWVDADLGFYNDDYVGCDVARGLGICYNGDNDDEGANGYGLNPPAIGVDFFKGPKADQGDGIDNDRDGLVDEGTNGIDDDGKNGIDDAAEQELIIMSSFIYYNNDDDPTNGNPKSASDYYNYLRSFWRDGKKITYSKDGRDQSKPEYKFMFSGETDPKGYGYSNPAPASVPTGHFKWTENNTDNQGGTNAPADRRFLQSAGPFTLVPGTVTDLTIGVVWGRANSGGAQGSLGLLKYADDRAQKLFDNDFVLPQGPDAPEVKVTELDQQLILTLIPKKLRTGQTTETYSEEDKSLRNNPFVKDPVYRFEGYKVYQLKDLTVSASELENRDRARLVAQGDVQNGVGTIINQDFDIDLGQVVNKVRVKGSDKGVFHTLNITTDQFATGNDRIVNFKSYHFMVVAYAYNGDSANVSDKYLEGRVNTISTGVPHKSNPENGGTVLYSSYGNRADITRVFGTGNGGYKLEITPDQEQQVVKDTKKQLLTYPGMNSPFVVKVYDPKKVQAGEFTVKLSSRLTYKKSSVTGSVNRVDLGDVVLSTGNFTTPDGYNATANPHVPSYPQVPGRGIVRRILPAIPVVDKKGVTIDSIITLDVEMLNDHLGGNFVLDGDSIENVGSTAIPRHKLVGHLKQKRPFTVVGKNFNAKVNQFVLSDFWYLTMPKSQEKIYADRTITEFNEQIIPEYGIAIEFKRGQNPGYQSLLNGLNGFITGSITYGNGPKWLDFVPNTDANKEEDKIAGKKPWLLKMYDQNSTGPSYELFNIDPNYTMINVLGGTWAPYAAAAKETDGPAYFKAGPDNRKLYSLNNIDVVFTNDKSKWTRVPVLQGVGGGANVYKLTKKLSDVPSVGKDGKPDNDVSNYPRRSPKPAVSMGWFPGYVIDLDKGTRLNMMFSEYGESNNTSNGSEQGRNLIWDPTSDASKNYGKNFIYVVNTTYDEGKGLSYDLDSAKYAITNPNSYLNFIQKAIFDKITWVGYPKLAPGATLNASDVRVSLRVNRAFTSYNSAGDYNVNDDNTPKAYTGVNSNPEYRFNTNGLVPQFEQVASAKSALDMIRVVPNPYYAYSQYEQRQLDNIVKITNLPKKCKISIYTVNGTLIKTFNKDAKETWIDWNLKNENSLPIASGVYIINVDAGNAGSKVVKWFGIMRPIDLESF
jgi:hypothetical protein